MPATGALGGRGPGLALGCLIFNAVVGVSVGFAYQAPISLGRTPRPERPSAMGKTTPFPPDTRVANVGVSYMRGILLTIFENPHYALTAPCRS